MIHHWLQYTVKTIAVPVDKTPSHGIDSVATLYPACTPLHYHKDSYPHIEAIRYGHTVGVNQLRIGCVRVGLTLVSHSNNVPTSLHTRVFRSSNGLPHRLHNQFVCTAKKPQVKHSHVKFLSS